jgi:hypothetical protein
MLTAFMLTGFRARLACLAAAVACVTLVGCERVPLLAPAGSTITLTSSATTLPVNGSTTLIAQVLEAGGTAPQSGTNVTFTTTLGTVRPANAETDSVGRVVVIFSAGDQSGTATITALSGGASTGTTGAVKIAVGAAAVGKVIVNANPALVPANGGQSTISAVVLDVNGNALPLAPVAFTTTAGTLTSGVVNSDLNGVASTVLTTSTAATVTASVGATGGSGTGTGTGGGTGTGTTTTSGQASGSVTVGILAQPTLVITPPTTPPSAGLPAAFTFTVTLPAANASAVKSLTVNWGDGEVRNLGPVSGTSIQSHVFQDPGTYLVTGTLLDTAGNSQSVSSTVTVIPAPQPTIIITPSPVPGHVGAQTTISVQVTIPAGLTVAKLTIDFGDNTTADLGGATSAAVPHVYLEAKIFTVKVFVTDSSTPPHTTIGTAVVSIVSP